MDTDLSYRICTTLGCGYREPRGSRLGSFRHGAFVCEKCLGINSDNELSRTCDEMVERVARAIASEIGVDPMGYTWRVYEGEAKAAIDAMTIPTDAMLRAAMNLRSINKGVVIEPQPANVWAAMIDEAKR